MCDENRVCFVLTGFGPFRGVSDNPTTTILQHFERSLSKPDEGGDSSGFDHELKAISPCLLKAIVFETSAEHVRSVLSRVLDDISQSVPSSSQHVVLLHLGVNFKGLKFQIERNAYNDASFRIPDEAGFQPKRECVLDTSRADISWGEKFKTTLDVDRLRRDLVAGGFDDDVVVSGDPGRFVCNYTYCYSLDRTNSFNSTRSSSEHEDGGLKGSAPKLHSLFLHVPPFEIQGEERQLEFVLKVMKSIQQQLGGI
mmetsp:Transcript_6104/g.10427  ORF Transcript_6104/g.10427 Transcript_6104/m.10427 type:complete len:254 (-) Transcript_6104:151-912(-)|eukprot:CAMPEP_0197443178 /NCGR_PEP_ID=MMETSP1175-20131217/8992_1 /TAXON_ID=1003142 /ORGANISM="Triceratium dubium, Strain CCMP147" /LENGTH=253 /DNA_ID=CAMNT_0042973775 /DNA_START=135 /DNA_END=896 /DNA_ORIENTATION=-